MSEEPNLIRLLVVDDERDFLDSTAKALGRRGFAVSVASSGRAALDLVQHQAIDVAVLDVKMPGMDGVELFRELRLRGYCWPIVMLTGHGTIQQAFETSREGVFDYLPKPCDLERLAMVCRRAVTFEETSVEFEADEPSAPDAPLRVLIVDDEKDFLEALKKVLSRRNMEVLTAGNGAEALEHMRDQPVDVTVLDLRLPGINGLEILRRIKQRFPRTQVIFLTGHPSVPVALQGMQEGAFDFLVKPQSVDALARRIREAAQARHTKLQQDTQSVVRQIMDGRTD